MMQTNQHSRLYVETYTARGLPGPGQTSQALNGNVVSVRQALLLD